MIRSWCWRCNTARPWYSLASGAHGNGMIVSLPHVVCTHAKDHTVFSLTLKISSTWKAEAGVQNFPKTSAVCKEVASSNSWLTNPASVLPSWSGEEISCMAHAHEETIVLDLHVISCEDAFQAWHSRHMQCPTNENFLGLVTERALCRKKKWPQEALVSLFFLYLVRFWSKNWRRNMPAAMSHGPWQKSVPQLPYPAAMASRTISTTWNVRHQTRQTRETEGETTWKNRVQPQ